MANVFIDTHLSKDKLTLFVDGNYFIIGCTVSEYSLWQKLLRMLVNGTTRLLENALYHDVSSRFDIVFHGILANTICTMR